MSDVVVVAELFDDMRFADFRFLEEASKLGKLHVALYSDALSSRPNANTCFARSATSAI